MRTYKLFLLVAALAVCSTWNVWGQGEKLTNVADVEAFSKANPKVPPLYDNRSFAWTDGKPGDGWTNVYSKANPENQTGKLLMVRCSNGASGVVDLASKKFLGIIPGSEGAALNSNFEPVWDRDGDPAHDNTIVFHDVGWPRIVRQTWNQPSAQQVICTAPDGYHFFQNGGEADLDDAGRYMAVKMFPIKGGYTNGAYVNVLNGVVDLKERRVLPGTVTGNPNAIDISPDGVWLAWLSHDGPAADHPNRFYRIADLRNGVTAKYLDVSSTVTTGEVAGVKLPYQSIGHNGWTRTAAGACVLVYQDNRDDWFKYFDPETGISTKLFKHGVGSPYPYFNQHIARNGPRGYAVMSTYINDSGVYLLELATGALKRFGDTNTAPATGAGGWTFSEAYACVNARGDRVYWGGNAGGTDNLEAYRLTIPGSTTPAPTPTPVIPALTPTPKPTATPIPTPPPAPPILMQGTQGGKPVTISIQVQ